MTLPTSHARHPRSLTDDSLNLSRTTLEVPTDTFNTIPPHTEDTEDTGTGKKKHTMSLKLVSQIRPLRLLAVLSLLLLLLASSAQVDARALSARFPVPEAGNMETHGRPFIGVTVSVPLSLPAPVTAPPSSVATSSVAASQVFGRQAVVSGGDVTIRIKGVGAGGADDSEDKVVVVGTTGSAGVSFASAGFGEKEKGTCARESGNFHIRRHWSITYTGDDKLNGEHCGLSVYDQLKTHLSCKPLTGWSCVSHGTPGVVTIMFKTLRTCRDEKVLKAVRKGTRGKIEVVACQHL